MKLKLAFATLIGLLISSAAIAQTNYKTVMVDTNGVLHRPTNFFSTNQIVTVNTNGTVSSPTNFWTANSNSINAVVGNVTSDWVLQNFASIDWVSITDAETEITNSTINTLGSVREFSIPATNASGTAALRLTRFANFSPFTGSGVRWNITNSFWVRLSVSGLSTNGDVVRIVLGGSPASTTNFLGLATNGVGLEIENRAGTQQMRLIARNGATNIQSAWVTTATDVGRLNVGVVSFGGLVNLYQSANSVPIAIVTNSVITNGPTTAVGGDSSAFSAGIIATNTNAEGRSLYIFDALLRATE